MKSEDREITRAELTAIEERLTCLENELETIVPRSNEDDFRLASLIEELDSLQQQVKYRPKRLRVV